MLDEANIGLPKKPRWNSGISFIQLQGDRCLTVEPQAFIHGTVTSCCSCMFGYNLLTIATT